MVVFIVSSSPQDHEEPLQQCDNESNGVSKDSEKGLDANGKGILCALLYFKSYFMFPLCLMFRQILINIKLCFHGWLSLYTSEPLSVYI